MKVSKKLATGVAGLALSTAGVAAGVPFASPANAACDFISVGTPYKTGSKVAAHASICAVKGWTAYVSIERWRGTWWDTIGGEQAIHADGGTRQGPISRNCGGTGTYTYRGKIYAVGAASQFTRDEYSAKARFAC